MNLAFVTYHDLPDFATDDRILVSYLAQHNVIVTPVIWDNPEVKWGEYDAVIIRSTWDYYKRYDEFRQWLDTIETIGIKVYNPVQVMRWNMDKSYFNAFVKQGLLLPPFQLCSKNSEANLAEILHTNQWKKAVVKPTISAGSFNTWVITPDLTAEDNEKFATLLNSRDLIVQQFMDEILTDGELSMMFFNKKFSHAVQKKAKAGDFRIQTQFGGTVTPVTPDPEIIQQATDLIASIEEPLLYARVDGIISQGSFYLMELELIEPVLYVHSNAEACANFYRALREMK
jgi:glutathione synthase/RimK-type ligase-like ATP-grasp enzyme